MQASIQISKEGLGGQQYIPAKVTHETVRGEADGKVDALGS